MTIRHLSTSLCCIIILMLISLSPARHRGGDRAFVPAPPL